MRAIVEGGGGDAIVENEDGKGRGEEDDQQVVMSDRSHHAFCTPTPWITAAHPRQTITSIRRLHARSVTYPPLPRKTTSQHIPLILLPIDTPATAPHSLHNLRKTHRLVHTGNRKRQILHHASHSTLSSGVGCRAGAGARSVEGGSCELVRDGE